DTEERKIFEVERKIHWILGSGNHSRTYIHHTESGELYQMPLAWYEDPERPGSGWWAMAPGFDRRFHLGVGRRVVRDCMVCHNAYPDVPAGNDAPGALQVYPTDLPEGIGCQRCHGPGAEHVRAALEGEMSFQELRGTIVNPAKLSPERRDDVCFSCHMQPSVAIPGVVRADRGAYTFQPGDDLAAHRVYVDPVEVGRAQEDRFEINHHPYRLRQSRCYLESGPAEMSCLTCHDPHRKVPRAQRAAHYRQACLSCHTVDSCQLEEMADASALKGSVAPDDCAGCHMPKRRTEDVVQVVMTDHLIQRRPGGPELLAPLEESEPVIEDLIFLDPERAPAGAEGQIYRAMAVLQVYSGDVDAVDFLQRQLAQTPQESVAPYLSLVRGQLGVDRPAAAADTARSILQRDPDNPQALDLLSVALAQQGRTADAVDTLRRAIVLVPDDPSTRFNYGRILFAAKQPEEATKQLRRAVELKPNLAIGWFYLGRIEAAAERWGTAAEHYRQALVVEPSFDRAYLGLAEMLQKTGDRTEAERVLRHGSTHARDTRAVKAALGELLAAETAGS
ncbi:MAG: tetratricopeptide repeat protein, partial [Acidobacteriota bacterium]|nr:tetratricopeptide repeat protein [Acidobacteriota bacterium]